MPPIRATASSLDRREITKLHAGLAKLRPPVDRAKLHRTELGASTKAEIKAFQRAVGLSAEGALTPETYSQLNAQLEHRFNAASQVSTVKIQALLARVSQPANLHPN